MDFARVQHTGTNQATASPKKKSAEGACHGCSAQVNQPGQAVMGRQSTASPGTPKFPDPFGYHRSRIPSWFFVVNLRTGSTLSSTKASINLPSIPATAILKYITGSAVGRSAHAEDE
jgi:hypothetical protein